MKNIKLIIFVVIAYVLQTVIVPDFNICGVAPNLMLVVTISIAFLFGSQIGTTVGLFSGLLLDLNQGRAVGIYAFLMMHLGMLVAQFNERFFKDNYLVAVILVGICTAIYEFFIFFFGVFTYSQNFGLGSATINVILSMLVNIISAAIIYPMILRINIEIEVGKNIFGR